MTIFPDQDSPREDETPKQTPLILCEKTQGISGFSKITLSPEISDKTLEQARQNIVNQLESKEGLTVQFQKGDTIKSLTFKNIPKGDYLARIIALNKDNERVHYTFIAGSQAIRKGKGSAKKISQYKNLGIPQIALSLGIEIIKFKNPSIQNLQGTIKSANIASILSRLHSPNILESGYFAHNITKSNIRNRVNISTFLHQSSTIEQIKNLAHYPASTQ